MNGQNTKQKIKLLMSDQGMSQTDLAVAAGIPKSTLNTILKKDSAGVSITALVKLASA